MCQFPPQVKPAPFSRHQSRVKDLSWLVFLWNSPCFYVHLDLLSQLRLRWIIRETMRFILVSLLDTMATASFVCLCTLSSPPSLSTTVSCGEACLNHAGIQMEVKSLRIACWCVHMHQFQFLSDESEEKELDILAVEHHSNHDGSFPLLLQLAWLKAALIHQCRHCPIMTMNETTREKSA